MSCQNLQVKPRAAFKSAEPVQLDSGYHMRDSGFTIAVQGIPVDIYTMEAARGCILVLPGWNFSRRLWIEKSTVLKQARAMNYILILPEMGKSIYTSKFYPETWSSMRKTLTLGWVTDTLIPALQAQQHLLLSGKRNYILGLSTGAHGAALIAEHTSGIFTSCGFMSGDYNQDLLPQDKVFEAMYGPHASFSERWKQADNPTEGIKSLNIPVFLSHGGADRVIPVSQSEQFYLALEQAHPKVAHQLWVIPNVGHDWNCWDASLRKMFAFWER